MRTEQDREWICYHYRKMRPEVYVSVFFGCRDNDAHLWDIIEAMVGEEMFCDIEFYDDS